MAPSPTIDRWLQALESRHLADLGFAEVRRSIQALSQRYVHATRALGSVRALDGRGKRAAFALYYAPLHLLTTSRIVTELETRSRGRLLDLGCGTGAAAAGWALSRDVSTLRTNGVDINSWVLGEARWNWKQLAVQGSTRRGDLRKVEVGETDALVLGWTVNELDPATRDALLEKLTAAARRGVEILVIEPISRRLTPWWDRWAERVVELGGRCDEWRFSGDLPERLREFDRAAGLDHRELTAKSLRIKIPRTEPRRPA